MLLNSFLKWSRKQLFLLKEVNWYIGVGDNLLSSVFRFPHCCSRFGLVYFLLGVAPQQKNSHGVRVDYTCFIGAFYCFAAVNLNGKGRVKVCCFGSGLGLTNRSSVGQKLHYSYKLDVYVNSCFLFLLYLVLYKGLLGDSTNTLWPIPTTLCIQLWFFLWFHLFQVDLKMSLTFWNGFKRTVTHILSLI